MKCVRSLSSQLHTEKRNTRVKPTFGSESLVQIQSAGELNSYNLRWILGLVQHKAGNFKKGKPKSCTKMQTEPANALFFCGQPLSFHWIHLWMRMRTHLLLKELRRRSSVFVPAWFSSTLFCEPWCGMEVIPLTLPLPPPFRLFISMS